MPKVDPRLNFYLNGSIENKFCQFTDPSRSAEFQIFEKNRIWSYLSEEVEKSGVTWFRRPLGPHELSPGREQVTHHRPVVIGRIGTGVGDLGPIRDFLLVVGVSKNECNTNTENKR